MWLPLQALAALPLWGIARGGTGLEMGANWSVLAVFGRYASPFDSYPCMWRRALPARVGGRHLWPPSPLQLVF